ncbi:MAG: hypothetical protein Q4P33_08510 [Flaviflexus sp.]|nr:hypothetical protein [Flaviflexus sp.]
MASDNIVLTSLLTQLGESPQIKAAAADVAGAVRSVRFSTGLRRSWREARTEASVHCVCSSLHAAGITVYPDTIRREVVDLGEPASWQARGAWRAHADVMDHVPPLNTRDVAPRPAPSAAAMLARLRRDVASTHPDPAVRAHAGIASGSAGDAERLLANIASANAPALVVLAVLIGQWLSDPPGLVGDGIVRDAMVRWVATSRGFEPTGTAVIDTAALGEMLHHYRSGTPEGMAIWVGAVSRAYVTAMSGALAISQSILAGRTDPSLG